MVTRQRSLLDITADPGLRRPRHPKARGTITAEVGRRTCWWTGTGIVGLLDRVGSPRQWDHLRRQWMCPVDRASDVLALAEHADGRPTIVVDVDR